MNQYCWFLKSMYILFIFHDTKFTEILKHQYVINYIENYYSYIIIHNKQLYFKLLTALFFSLKKVYQI